MVSGSPARCVGASYCSKARCIRRSRVGPGPKAEAILKEYDSDGTVSALSFRIRTEFGVLTFLLPAIIADNLLSNSPIEIMKADLSTNDIIRIQVVSRLSDLLFDELQKINIDGAPLSARRIHITALENAAAVQRAMIDLLAGIPGEGTASPEHN